MLLPLLRRGHIQTKLRRIEPCQAVNVNNLIPQNAWQLLRPASRTFGNSSDNDDKHEIARQKYHAALMEQKVAAHIEGQRLRQQASQVARPFRETGGSTQGAANIMALLLRPTSPSLGRRFAGIFFSVAFVTGAHWLLHPGDPFCILSMGLGAFVYVAVVGNSHSALWYCIAAPLTMAALLVFPSWPSYLRSLEAPQPNQLRRRRDYR
eukprot:TRINITY_DN13645_c0_g1_i1.p1 TRINITY_DN13645_c0_g1~~TRINITY_DN13645_c0_g1_i1.p1  ORF type:complete len:208 (-),score=33.69 TRINITY_DN13645_c0_g1_i1:216-839(-)